MIGRAITANGTVATTISGCSRAFASVSSTWAYSGSVKLPIGFAGLLSVTPRSATALVAARYPSCPAFGTSINRPVMSPAANRGGERKKAVNERHVGDSGRIS